MDAGATQAVSVTSQTRSLNAQSSRQDKTLTTIKSTCMVALRDLFVKLIHSQGIADRMGTNLRASLIGCYESHWSRSIEYCLRKRLNVFEVDCQSFSKYLLYLFQVDCYVPSTIISHRTSIASVLQHWKYEPANDPCIRGIFAPKFSVGPTSPMKNDATMELSSSCQPCYHLPFPMVQSIDPAMTSLTKNGGRSIQHFCCCWLLPGGDPICMLYVCQPASSHVEMCRISWLSISYHVLFYWLRTR